MNDNITLLERVKKGDKEAEEQLVLSNMNLIGSIAKRFSNCGCENDDIMQIGAIGLIKAIHKFDLSYGVKFSTYAVPVIMGEIKRFLRDDGMVKVSRSLKENAQKGKKCRELLRLRLGREPTISEISAECQISEDDLLEAFDAVTPVETITRTDKDGNETELFVSYKEDNEEKILNHIFVEDMLNSLENREKQIIVLRYFKGKTQTETAKIIGVSQVQISRIEKSVVNRLRCEYS